MAATESRNSNYRHIFLNKYRINMNEVSLCMFSDIRNKMPPPIFDTMHFNSYYDDIDVKMGAATTGTWPCTWNALCWSLCDPFAKEISHSISLH